MQDLSLTASPLACFVASRSPDHPSRSSAISCISFFLSFRINQRKIANLTSKDRERRNCRLSPRFFYFSIFTGELALATKQCQRKRKYIKEKSGRNFREFGRDLMEKREHVYKQNSLYPVHMLPSICDTCRDPYPGNISITNSYVFVVIYVNNI